jgi:membrane fusion protein (multidrug efflux system)
VGRGEPTLLTTISQVDPILVEMRLSESDLLQYQQVRRERGEPAAKDITLFLSDKTEHPHKGHVSVVDRNVDPATGTLLIMISFPNPERTVRPGQFARIRGVRDVIEDALLVPQTAVEELQGSFRLYLAGPGDVVEVRTVRMGSREGPLWVVAEGLRPTDRVIVEGRQKVRAGARVAPIPVEIADPAAPAPPGNG